MSNWIGEAENPAIRVDTQRRQTYPCTNVSSLEEMTRKGARRLGLGPVLERYDTDEYGDYQDLQRLPRVAERVEYQDIYPANTRWTAANSIAAGDVRPLAATAAAAPAAAPMAMAMHWTR